jgi:predicted nucleic acid-binding protein
VILLDTSVLVAALTGARELAPALRQVITSGERLGISSIVLYEWLRGPRSESEIAAQEQLVPTETAWPFGTTEALVAVSVYRRLARSRQREVDIAIAAAAMARGAQLWTVNIRDFSDIPDLTLFDPA